MFRRFSWGALPLVGALCACGLDADSRASTDASEGGALDAAGDLGDASGSGGGSVDVPSIGGSVDQADDPQTRPACPKVSEAVVADPVSAAETLSEILWNEPADDALLVRASHVKEESDLVALAQFMLSDPRVRAGAARFFPWWVTGKGFESVTDKSASLAPALDPKIYESMVNEVVSYGADVLSPSSDGDAQALLTGGRAYIDEALFSHYGFVGSYEESASFVVDERRFGIFSSGLFGVTHANLGETSPPARGAALRAQLLCERIPGRPKAVPAPRAKKKEETGRDYWTEVVLEKKECQTCHSLTTEIGLGFEELDALGRVGSEGEVDATTVVFGLAGEEQTYKHPREWLQDLSENPAVWECFGSKWVEFLFAGAKLPKTSEIESDFDFSRLVECSESGDQGPDLGLFLSQLLMSSAVRSSFACEKARCLEGDLCVLTGPAHSPTGKCVDKSPASCGAAKECTCREGNRGETYQDCTIP